MLTRIVSRAPGFLASLFYCLVVVTLGLVAVYDKRLFHYATSGYLVAPAALYVAAALALVAVALLALVRRHADATGRDAGAEGVPRSGDRGFYLVLVACFAAAYLAQLFVSSHIYFRTGWDVQIIDGEVLRHLQGEAWQSEEGRYYFSVYPNNLLLLHTLVSLRQLGAALCPAAPERLLQYATCVPANVATLLSCCSVYKLTARKGLALACAAVGIVLVVLSPWMVIPYSDQVAILFPSLALFCWTFVRRPAPRYALASFACVVGYYYKPTAIFALAAIALVAVSDLPRLLAREGHSHGGRGRVWWRAGTALVAALVGAGAAVGLYCAVTAPDQAVLDGDARMTWTHFLMMGLNPETEGYWNGDDVTFSELQPNVAAREGANREVIAQRVRDLGPRGLLIQMAKKDMLAYGDGTFAWGIESGFFSEIPQDERPATALLRSVFYPSEVEGRGGGEHYEAWASLEQVLWFSVLASTTLNLAAFGGRRRRLGDDKDVGAASGTAPGAARHLAPGAAGSGCERDPEEARRAMRNAAATSLLALSLFLMLFETRARYLFLYAPIYVMLAGLGLDAADRRIACWRASRTSQTRAAHAAKAAD